MKVCTWQDPFSKEHRASDTSWRRWVRSPSWVACRKQTTLGFPNLFLLLIVSAGPSRAVNTDLQGPDENAWLLGVHPSGTDNHPWLCNAGLYATGCGKSRTTGQRLCEEGNCLLLISFRKGQACPEHVFSLQCFQSSQRLWSSCQQVPSQICLLEWLFTCPCF